MSILVVNECDTSRLGLAVESVDGWPDGLSVGIRPQPIAGRIGSLVLPPDPDVAPRRLTVRGKLKCATFADLLANRDLLKDRLSNGTLEVRFIDRPDRVAFALCQVLRTPGIGPAMATRSPAGCEAEIELLCPDPLVYAAQPTEVAFDNTAEALPLGTAPVAPIITIMGAATNPVVTYRDSTGATRGAMTLTITLAATDYLEVDCELGVITKYVSGVATVVNSILTAGDFLRFDPVHGNVVESIWPTIATSQGIGAASYRRAWR